VVSEATSKECSFSLDPQSAPRDAAGKITGRPQPFLYGAWGPIMRPSLTRRIELAETGTPTIMGRLYYVATEEIAADLWATA
jgi:hypothetical protein